MEEYNIDFDSYQKHVKTTDKAVDEYVLIYGLVGEVGEILTVFKKHKLNKYPNFKHELEDELGDALWYLFAIASKHDLSMGKVIAKNKRQPFTEEKEIKFYNYQQHAKKTDKKQNNEDVLIYDLVGKVSKILTAFKKHKLNSYPNFKHKLEARLWGVLRCLSAIASKHDLSMSKVAIKNKNKSQSLFGNSKNQPYDFDETYPEHEKLLRNLEIEFIVDNDMVRMQMGDCFIGDPITDNSYYKDYYRYHDAFHLAYAAVLGWSPVVRKMLKRKRKSNNETDKVEDGARAAIIEEAVSILVFRDAEDRDYYKDKNRNINSRTMKMIMSLVKGLEVEICTANDWTKAILLGYEMYNNLKENNGGKLSVDLEKRKITFTKPNAKN